MQSEEESVKCKDAIAITVRGLFLVLVVLAALFATAQTAAAEGTPTQLIIFTDRKVYTDWFFDQAKTNGVAPNNVRVDSSNLTFFVYAVILDDDGNIMKGRSSYLSGIINDTAQLDHYNKGTNATHHADLGDPNLINGPLIFNDTGLSGDNQANDGIYTAKFDPTDFADSWSTTNVAGDDHFKINITVTDSNLGKSVYTYVLLNGIRCHGALGSHGTHNDGVMPGGVDNCAVCHPGYEHFYENKSGTIPYSMQDVHFKKVAEPTVISDDKNFDDYRWNTSNITKTGVGGVDWKTYLPGSGYCPFCHTDAAGNVLDYGNGDRLTLTDKPSCGAGSSYYGGCHANTNITGTKVVNWTQSAATGTYRWNNNITVAKSHNYTGNKANASCVICHDGSHGLSLPNVSYVSYTINEQCWLCHNISGGLNITANGGKNVNHNNPDCKVCHKNATGALDAHLVPAAVFGGVNCTSCHNISGSATGSIVNFTSVNKSMHGGLNKNASSTGGNATNKPCWACHGTINANGYANESDQPVNSHNDTVYQNPRDCYDCHNDTVSLFSAKGITDHIPSGLSKNTDVNTSSYNNTYCSYCHNNSIRPSFDPDGFGLTGGSPINASVSHYGANDTAGKLMSPTNNSTDCVYCHRNSSNMLKWGILPNSLANLSNKNGTAGTETNHTPYTSSSQCSSCHGGYTITASFTFHNAALGAGAVGGVNCTSCHNIGGSANNVNFSSVNKSMHANLNKNATSIGGNASNKPCWACHGTINATSGLANESDQPTDGHNTTVYKNPRECKYCHITGILRFNATNVTDHIPSGYSSLTDVNTSSYNNTYCSYCHNNSVYNGNDSSMGLSNQGSPMNASVSHYGANKTANMSMTAANDSTDCVYCHRNNSNMLKWGILNGSTANITKKNGTAGTGINHTPYTASIVCKDCHGAYNIATSTFHDAVISNGSEGGPNCIGCHYTGSPYNDINITSFNQSTHFGMNSANSSANGACWACHDTDGNVTSGHGDKQKTPKSCDVCHLASGTYYTQSQSWGGLRVDEHYYSGNQIKAGNSSSNLTSCINCHENISEMILYNNDTDTGTTFTGDGIRLNGGNRSAYHYGKNRTDLRTWNGSNTANCSYCHQNSNTFFNITMVNAADNSTIQNHSTGSSPNCYNSTCHSSGWLHNSTLTRPSLPLPNTTYCQTCHAGKQEHNGTQQCSKCHINTSSSDTIHPIKYIQTTGLFSTNNITAANCTNCHQSVLSSNFSTAPQIPATLKHSSNLSNGSIWNSTTTPYWTTEETACYYCHNDTKHNSTALGKISALLNTSNKRNGQLATTVWCADCHLNKTNTNYKGTLWTQAPPLITVNNTGKARWDNHSGYFSSGYNDSVCEGCHAQNISAAGTSLNYSHSLDEGVAGGPDCISCHNLATGLSGGAPSGINFTSFNQSTHFGMNSANSSANGACWACHDTDGNVTSGHGDKQKTPKSCDVCHLASGTYYTQSQSWGGLRVDEHYYSGNQIKAGNSSSNLTSCINCHENISEMILYNNDTDTGTTFTGDGIRLNGGNRSAYHYGKNRTDLRTWNGSNTANCSYCHQNSNTFFNITMVNAADNSTIQNHSTGSSPNCYNSTCHSSGWLHNSTLTRPSLPLPNTTYCQTCHAGKQEHNGTQQCSKCHINTSSSDTIHPIKYIQTTGLFSTNNITAANCTNCHQSVLSSNFSTAPQIPATLKHSSNLSNGSIWNSTTTPYWTTEETACYYCHNDTKHNSTALGKISALLNTSNKRNGQLATTVWCADCHLNKTNTNYKGTLWTQAPPLITVNNTGKARWDNHSGYFSSGYNDSVCEGCHAQNISAAGTSLNYSHSLDEGVAGGPNCISCHNLATGLQNGAPSGIDYTAFNQSKHINMNSANSTTNGACWACHDTDGNVTSGHPDKKDTPKVCDECHLDTGAYYSQSLGWGLLVTVKQHYYSSTKIKAGNSTSVIASCINCHENVSEMLLDNIDTDTGSFTGDGIRQNGGNKSFYHYGSDRQDLRVDVSNENCYYCHQNSSTAFAVAMRNASANSSIFNHTDNQVVECTNGNCHSTGLIHDDTLNKPSFTNGQCTGCHSLLSPSISNTHNRSTINCWNCHQDPNSSTYRTKAHGMMYPQTNGTYSRFDKGTPANCTTCHVYNLVNTSTARAIQVPGLNHSTDLYSGSKWNGSQSGYWDNTSKATACYYCHQNGMHKLYSPLLGNVSTIQGTNKVKNSNLSSSRWCAACHYNDSTSNYKGNLLNPQPPEILNKSGKVPTAASDGTAFYNHSSDLATNKNDSKCKECHGVVLQQYTETTLNFSHAVGEGGGGPDCVSSGCHGTTGSPSSPYMNWTSLKSGMHAGLNSGATNTTSLTDPIDKACWACHGDGTEPSGHPSKYKQPYYCADCHVASGSIAGKYQAKNATEHQHVDARILTNSTYARCENCHNNSLVTYLDNETNSLTNYTVGNVSHYGANKTAGKLMEPAVNSTNCVYCHLNNSNRQKWANATNSSATKPDIHGTFNDTTVSSKCWECHVDGGISSVTSGFTLHNASLNQGASEFCLTCHVAGGSAQRVNVSSGDLGMHVDLNLSDGAGNLSNGDCWVCHFGYPQPGGGTHSYNVSRQNTYYCEDCHGPVKNATAIPNATTKVLTNFYHGKSYFDSAPRYKDCTICHAANDSRKDSNGNRLKIYHNQTPLGKVANPGWAGWSVGSVPGCNDCHQTKNSNDAPFHAPGKDHYVSASGGCTKNCHKDNIIGNVHRQYLFGDIQKLYGITPPVIPSVTINSPVFAGVDVNITVHGQDNGNQIEAARYSVVNSSGAEVIGWTYMTPQDNKFKSRSEIAKGSINTSSLQSGNYTVYIQVMASGPRADQTKRAYPYNGAWSSVASTGFMVI